MVPDTPRIFGQYVMSGTREFWQFYYIMLSFTLEFCSFTSDWHPLFQIPNSSPDCLCNVLEIIFRKGIHAKNAQKFSSHPAAALWGKNPSELSFEILQNYKWYGSLISYMYDEQLEKYLGEIIEVQKFEYEIS